MNGVPNAVRPERRIAAGFALAIAAGTLLLWLPVSSSSGESPPFIDALFTATSAVCVTGLTTVDTGTYWSPFGRVVITALIQVGGIGIMVLATLIFLAVFRRVGIATRSSTQVETKSLSQADTKRVIVRIVIFSIIAEIALAMILLTRFIGDYGYGVTEGVSHAVFHSISAFNNAGFSLYPDNLVRFAQDPWILIPIAVAVIVGGIGFPVVFELARKWRRLGGLSILSRITVALTVSLLILATFVFLVTENGNGATWGSLPPGQQILQAFFTGVMPRTAGFNIVPVDEMRAESLALTNVLMFIGGGSAGTAGGIKVTTLGVLIFIIIAEIRGKSDVEVGNKRVPSEIQRQALAIVAIGLALVALGTVLLLVLTDWGFERVLFETVSAFGTVGLSTGITSTLSDSAKLVLVALMFVGRIGPLTFALALASRSTTRLHRRPEERIPLG